MRNNEQNQNAEEWIESILQEMILDEKIGMVHGAGFFRNQGVKRLGIPYLVMSDGPMGVRKDFPDASWVAVGQSYDYSSYLPSNSAIASTWNPKRAYESGSVLGEEARGRGKDVILAPGINIKRDPLCGRNFEYMSEDPHLTASICVPMIQGIQSHDTAACVKHFAANAQETERLWIDMQMEERTLREIYLPAFQAAVQKAGTYSLMGAYNKVNGENCCENQYLLNQILRDEWNFDGAVISDWGGVHRTKEAAEAGLDLEMSITPDFDDYVLAKPLKEAIERGEISQHVLDEKVKNLLRLLLRIKKAGPSAPCRKAGTYNTPAHHQALYETACESIILLKNDNNNLPLHINAQTSGKIAVIGQNAERLHADGGGSGEIKALYEISPLMGLKTRLGGTVEVRYAQGYYNPILPDANDLNWQQASLERRIEARKGAEETEEEKAQRLEVEQNQALLREEAVALAKECDEVIFIGGLNHDYDLEGRDRDNMKLPYAQNELIEALLSVNPNLVVVMVAGSPVEMPWADKVKSIVWMYYAGMEGGNALADVLLGNVNPSGKLPESFPVSYSDCVTCQNGQFGKTDKVVFEEGVFVGYRYFETQQVNTQFCFGHGLSYTSFELLSPSVEVKETEADGFDGEVTVTINAMLQNNGDVAGAETVQCYVEEVHSSVKRPVKELRAFEKVFVREKETGELTLHLNKEAFAYYDDAEQCFVVNPGVYRLHVGMSVKDIRYVTEITIGQEYRIAR